MFADDTNLFIKDKNLGSLVANANNELDKISNWFKLNKLSLNIKKRTSYCSRVERENWMKNRN